VALPRRRARASFFATAALLLRCLKKRALFAAWYPLPLPRLVADALVLLRCICGGLRLIHSRPRRRVISCGDRISASLRRDTDTGASRQWRAWCGLAAGRGDCCVLFVLFSASAKASRDWYGGQASVHLCGGGHQYGGRGAQRPRRGKISFISGDIGGCRTRRPSCLAVPLVSCPRVGPLAFSWYQGCGAFIMLSRCAASATTACKTRRHKSLSSRTQAARASCTLTGWLFSSVRAPPRMFVGATASLVFSSHLRTQISCATSNRRRCAHSRRAAQNVAAREHRTCHFHARCASRRRRRRAAKQARAQTWALPHYLDGVMGVGYERAGRCRPHCRRQHGAGGTSGRRREGRRRQAAQAEGVASEGKGAAIGQWRAAANLIKRANGCSPASVRRGSGRASIWLVRATSQAGRQTCVWAARGSRFRLKTSALSGQTAK